MTTLDTMLDLLDHGRDGEPRWTVLDARDADAAAQLVRLLAAEGERRGYVPVAAERVPALVRAMPEEMRHRSFIVLQTCTGTDGTNPWPLLAMAGMNPRPHVLITIRLGRPTHAVVLREARSAFSSDRTTARPSTWSADVVKHLARAEEAIALARAGRHEPAVRMLRESAAALARRREAVAAGRVGVLLGRVLLERGRADDADAAFAEAVTQLDPVAPDTAAAARVWMARARTDAGRLSDAEGLLRATRMSGTLPEGEVKRWGNAALARCLAWQGRVAEAEQILDLQAPFDADADPAMVVPVLTTQVGVLLALGRVFDAGQRARAAIDRADRSGDPILLASAGIAHLRVLSATGDFVLASERRTDLLEHMRRQHLPLHALRVRMIWAGMLRHGQRQADAARELRACQRLARAAPELLRRHLHRMMNPPEPAPAGSTAGQALFTVAMVRALQEEDDDQTAVQRALTQACETLHASRVELQTAAAGPLTTIATAGTGLAARLGQRALEAGILIGPEQREGVWQAAIPVRVAHRILGVVTCRWPLGREPLAGAGELLDVTATVIAPRVDALTAARAEAARAATTVPELIGDSDAIGELRRSIARAAASPFAIVVEGESGVGKELVARAIHHLSPRRDRRFCDINCAALPEDLVESELFGHAKGAFTGALIERRGLFEEAHGGTLFLDELPDLSLRSQAKLLRVIQQGEIRRLGEAFSRKVDVRVVTATNRSMRDEVTAGRFRQDLLYRLDVIRIAIPPLRERPADIPMLAHHFWRSAAERAGTRAQLSHAVLSELARYHWPGNVRELQNVIAALAVAAPARGAVRPSQLPPAVAGSVSVSSGRLADARRQFERRFIEVALARAGGSRTRASQQLGLSRQGLLKLMARVGLS